MKEWGDAFKRVLADAGLSEEVLAGRLGVKLSTVHKWTITGAPNYVYAHLEDVLTGRTPTVAKTSRT
jgi:hypothetical protein